MSWPWRKKGGFIKGSSGSINVADLKKPVKPTPIRKPKQSRNIIVGGHLYYWQHTGPFDHLNANDRRAYAPGEHAYLSGIIIWDAESRQRWRIAWPNIARHPDGGLYYPILPRHVASYIVKHIQKGMTS